MADFDSFVAPISGDQPCGPDCEYDNDFLALTQAAVGKAEQQFGDTVIPAGEPDWREVDRLGQALLARTKDLRVVAWLTLANTHLHGVLEFAKGLQFAQTLCEQYWDSVHPRIEVDGEVDPYLRMNAIAAFSAAEFSGENRLILALRLATIVRTPLTLNFRDLELAFNKSPDAAYALTHIEPILVASLASGSKELAAIADAYASYQAMRTLVEDRVSAAETPDMQRLSSVLKPVARGLEYLRVAAASGADGAGGATADELTANSTIGATGEALVVSSSAVGGMGAIQNRDDVRRTLDRVCEYLERHEPSNPASLFVRRAQRMLGMPFLELMRELSPDSVTHLETLTGVQSPSQNS